MAEYAEAGTDKAISAVLILVMGAALTVGTWSIYTLLTDLFGAPRLVAAFGALMFDGAALFFALLSHRYATSPDSGIAPRLAMVVMVTASAWINWRHADMEHWGRVGSILLAGAPVTAELTFELWRRWKDREARRAQGRTPKALPVLGLIAWVRYPGRSWRVASGAILSTLEQIENATAAGQLDVARADQPGMPGHVPGQPGNLPGARQGETVQLQTVRLEIAAAPAAAHSAAGQLVPARATKPAVLPEPVLAAQAPAGHDLGQDAGQPEISIAKAVRTAINEIGTDIDAVTARASELKPESDRSSVRREARRQIGSLPGTGLYM